MTEFLAPQGFFCAVSIEVLTLRFALQKQVQLDFLLNRNKLRYEL